MNKKLINYKIIYVVAIAAFLSVFCLRLFYTISLSQPYHIITSGGEEESFYAIWKYIHGLKVYEDFHKIPFASSLFNWGFYFSYGNIINLILWTFNLGDEWIPQIGRILTLTGCITGFLFSIKTARLLINTDKLSLLQSSILVSFFGGYIMGFWAITVRPDAWAVTAEVIAFYYFLLHLKKNNLTYLIVSLLFFYISWSFKQNFFTIIAGCIVFLLLKKSWKQAIFLGMPFLVMVLLTYLIGSEEYKYLLVKSQARMSMDILTGYVNLKMGVLKYLGAVLFGIALVFFIFHRFSLRKVLKKIIHSPNLLLLSICFTISFVLFFFMAMKAGASDNYFFSSFIILAFLLITVTQKLSELSRLTNSIHAAYAFVCLISIAAGVLILTGKTGQLDLRSASKRYEHLKSIIKSSKKPLLVENDNYGNIPWINDSKENFIIASTYFYKQEYGEKFERDGFEGLMKEGYFATIINENSKKADYKEKYRVTDSVITNDYSWYIWKKK